MKHISILILLLLAHVATLGSNPVTILANETRTFQVSGKLENSELIWKTSGAKIISQNDESITLCYTKEGEYSITVCEKEPMANCLGEFYTIDIIVEPSNLPEPEIPDEPEPEPEDPEIPEEPINPEPDIPQEPEIEKIVLEIPNIFTPNGDGINDSFHIKYNIKPSSYQIYIYNRSGRRVFQSHDADFIWNGKGCSPDTYFYTIQYSDTNGAAKSANGTINLVAKK
ncbi:MAG: gliding motility-associated C-terminal domain-containing protein [Bacteroidales bacterium]|nr:gliding motility-associated C-terminal domain-containing protein [Bacteroidales bacterium]